MTRLILAALLAASPASAQDPATQFESALGAFLLPTAQDLSLGGLLDDDPIEALLPSLEGDWASALILFPARGAFDEGLLGRACEANPLTLAAIAPRSFELRRSTGPEGEERTLAVRHDFILGNSFDRSVPEAEAMAFLGLDALPDPGVGQLNFFAMRGEVSLFHPSPDVLVLVAPGGAPEILVRCPLA